jgi:SAM-dependent methyltransferase
MEQHRIWDHFQTTRVDIFDPARGRYARMAREVRRCLGRDGGRVLNIGIGSGGLEQLLLAKGWRVASLDPSAKAVEKLASLGVDARCGYAQDMPFDSDSFDVVVASEVLEHIEPDTRKQVLREISRVLAPGGWFVGSVPYREVLADSEVICPDCGKVFHRWGHVSSFDLPQLRAELIGVFSTLRAKRTSFVDWRSARSPMRIALALATSVLGRMGESVVHPSIVFAAR